MHYSMPDFPVLHCLLGFAQTHVHRVSDVIQPSHLLLPPFPLALNHSPDQGLFQRVGSSHQVAKGLELQLQHQSFQWIFRTDFLSDWLTCSPCSPRDSQESSPALWFESINSSALNLSAMQEKPGLGRSSGEEKGYPLQYSGLENFMDYIVYGVAKSQT